MQQFTGLQYLQMDIAASFGLDKNTWDERLAWFQGHQFEIEHASDDGLKLFVRSAEEPARALAGILAYRQTLQGEAIGYRCSLDATASGLQLLSLLSGCVGGAQLSNLVDTGQRVDAYTHVHEAVCALLNISPSVFPIPRKASKNALMTHLYGSRAVPKRVFGEGTEALAAFYQAIDLLLPGANLLNHDLLGLWDSSTLAHCWTLPDGFEAVIKVMSTIEHPVHFLGKDYAVIEKVNQPMEAGLSLGANIIHSIDGMVVREMNRRCNFTADVVNDLSYLLTTGAMGGRSTVRQKDLALLRILTAYDMTGFLSAVVFEHLDESNLGLLTTGQKQALIALIDSLPEQAFPIVCVHDCFTFHPNHGNDVRQQYINILAELAESTTLDAIVSEIAGRPIPVNKLSDLAPHIRASEYAIC